MRQSLPAWRRFTRPRSPAGACRGPTCRRIKSPAIRAPRRWRMRESESPTRLPRWLRRLQKYGSTSTAQRRSATCSYGHGDALAFVCPRRNGVAHSEFRRQSRLQPQRCNQVALRAVKTGKAGHGCMPDRGASGGLAGALNLKINPSSNLLPTQPWSRTVFRLILDGRGTSIAGACAPPGAPSTRPRHRPRSG